MAYGVVHRFPAGTREQYEASLAAVHPSRDRLPEGQLFHAAGASPDGFTIVAIHDSEASWAAFRDGILMPRFQRGIAGGFKTAPQETTFDVYNLQQEAGTSSGVSANKELVRNAFRDLLGRKDPGTLEQYCSDDFYDHNPPLGAPPGDIHAVRRAFENLYRVFPDVNGRIDEMLADADRVFVRCTFAATHRGDLAGVPATGRRVSFESWHVFRVANGKIAEHRERIDTMELMRQLATPAQAADESHAPH